MGFSVFLMWQVGKLRKEVNYYRSFHKRDSERARLIWEEVRRTKWGITYLKLNEIWEMTKPQEEKVSP